MLDLRDSKWFLCPNPNPRALQRLFCLPYAGGNALAYQFWSKYLPSTIEVCAVKLPGRGSRLPEAPFDRMSDLIIELVQAFKAYLDKPFVVFGHSMGAQIGFELVRGLYREGLPKPELLVVSGHGAPQLPKKNPCLHQMSDKKLLSTLYSYGGTLKDVFANEELIPLLLPIIRVDLTMLETYRYQPGPALECPILAFGSTEDPYIACDDLEPWREQTCKNFQVHLFSGDHFFIHSHEQEVLATLANYLKFYGS